jgi:hypothetical protein
MIPKGAIARLGEERMRNVVVLPRLRLTPGDLLIARRESQLDTACRCLFRLLLLSWHKYDRKEGTSRQLVRDHTTFLSFDAKGKEPSLIKINNIPNTHTPCSSFLVRALPREPFRNTGEPCSGESA